jgi:carboxypeptidase Q
MRTFAPFALLLLLSFPVFAAEPVDVDAMARIRNQAFRDSKVMETASTLTDRYGSRLTASPGLREAQEWAKKELESYGLVNVQLEPWGPFDRGWQNDFVSVRMVAPSVATMYALPLAWAEGTGGVVSGEVMRVEIDDKDDFEAYRGKLDGRILLLGAEPALAPIKDAAMRRYNDGELDELTVYDIPAERDARYERYMKRRAFRDELAAFLREEKALAVIHPGTGNGGGSFHVQSAGSWEKDKSPGVPAVSMAPEHWGQIHRLLKAEQPVRLELDIRNQVFEDMPGDYNVIAEIPGTDSRAGVVMMGAHLDAWHSSTGATDNAAGVAVVMEAARILSRFEKRPKRTIRLALWSGEEQGIYGSRRYVEKHFASWPEPEDADQKEISPWYRKDAPKPTLKPEQKTISAYFNLDNGTGKIRGIYTQENLAVAPIFRSWLEPFHDLGARTVTTNNTGGTDHLPFDAAGIPAFQFIQDQVEYSTRTHHTNWDSYERLQREDLMQASAVLAGFVWQAANRPEMLPRKPLD